MTFTENTKFRRSPNVVSRDIGNELLLVPIRGGVGDLDAIFSFNNVGADVWTLMEKEQSLEQLTAWVVDHYEASRNEVQADLSEFMSDLVKSGLATVAPGPVLVLDARSVHHASR